MSEEITKEKTENKGTIIYLNRLRLIAAFFVVCIHCVGDLVNNFNYNGFDWGVFSVINIVVRTAVPIFVMISGALFLDENKSISIKKLLLNNVLRIVVIYFLWTFIYNIETLSWQGILDALKGFDTPYWHLWFLPMLIGLYLLTPVLRILCKKENKKTVEYFLILFVVLNCILAFCEGLNISPFIDYVFNSLRSFVEFLSIDYVGLYVAGWYLHNFALSKNKRIILYVSAIILCVFSSIIGLNKEISEINAFILISNNIGIINFVIACSIFVFIKNNKIINKKSKFLDYFSNCTMGCYLIHMKIQHFLFGLCFGSFVYGTQILPLRVLAYFAFALTTYILSMLISVLFNLLPKKIKRWIM